MGFILFVCERDGAKNLSTIHFCSIQTIRADDSKAVGWTTGVIGTARLRCAGFRLLNRRLALQ